MFPKYILTKDLRILKFRWADPNRDVAAYGRIRDMSTTSWRRFFHISNKHDLFYWGNSGR